MGYLDQALKVIEEKKDPHRGHSQDFFSKTCYEINEKNELSPDSEIPSQVTRKDFQTLFEKAVAEVGGYLSGDSGNRTGGFPRLGQGNSGCRRPNKRDLVKVRKGAG